ncbi:MAG: hypothetical protein M1402_01880, partial [Candidatus Thermoplasmatota archaeon]|nr:hypothetical protein [Candidatus Thermoplasmatota archaeon]
MNILFILYFIIMMALALSSIIVLLLSVRLKGGDSRRARSLQIFRTSEYITIVTGAMAILYEYLSLETNIFSQVEVWYGVLFII